jgi:nitrite reductase/ring-hydroxylating ferredoxin subunit
VCGGVCARAVALSVPGRSKSENRAFQKRNEQGTDIHVDERSDIPVDGSRRRVLARLVQGAAALVGGLFAGLLGVFAVNPRSRASEDRWVKAVPLDSLLDDTPRAVVLSVPRVHGWHRERARHVVYVARGGDDAAPTVRAMSATCTHLGCLVSWDMEAERFTCPCHGGAYDASGTVVAGPPPRALERIDARIETRDGASVVLVRV